MAYNLIVAYDLDVPGQNYEAVRSRIRETGQWLQFQYSLFYVHSLMTPRQVFDHVAAVMDANDRLMVINALGAVVSAPQSAIDVVNRVWSSQAA